MINQSEIYRKEFIFDIDTKQGDKESNSKHLNLMTLIHRLNLYTE